MIRKIVKPDNNTLVIVIPDEYVGKEIEYILLPVNNKNEDNIDLIGGSLHKYSNTKKQNLENIAWELHIKDKFAK